MSESATPESGSLSVEQAIASLTPEAQPEPVEQAPVEAEEPDETPEEPQGESSSPEDAEDGAETPAEDAETEAEEPAVEPLDPPKYWTQDAKAKFAELPAELQAVVLEQEGPREEAAAKAKAEAATEVKAAQEQLKGVQTLAQQLETFLPEAIQTFNQRWGEPDWEATIEQYGVEEAAKLEARYKKEQSQLQKVAQATQEAKAQAHQAFVLEQFQKLTDLDPVLAPDAKDPTKGTEERQKVTKYLLDTGIPRDAVAKISAVEMTLARKAMLWDQAQTKLHAAPKPKPAAPVQKKAPVRPAAAQAQSPAQRSASQVANRFAQTRSVDDAVALLLAKG